MQESTLRAIRGLLVQEEGYKRFPYKDSRGVLTIGCGRNLDDRGIFYQEAITMLENDIDYFDNQLALKLDCYNNLSENRKVALISMVFNLGLVGFLKFHDMIAALEKGDYEEAANEMLDSQAAKQDKNRYEALANIMRKDAL